uniref:Glycoamylase-like domain-containing protein n=1 Tax=mine drainage metagenome TaxID=410659 RepID=E6PYI6_9ZZZZ
MHPGYAEEPRIAALAKLYFVAVESVFTEQTLIFFLRELQALEPLTAREVAHVGVYLKFVLMEQILDDAQTLLTSSCEDIAARVLTALDSLRAIGLMEWADILEPLVVFDAILRKDPIGAYAAMDYESREHYRKRVAFISRYSDFSESRVAQTAINLAANASLSPRLQQREKNRHRHVGYYLFEEGFQQLSERVGLHPPLTWRIREGIRSGADEFYIGSIVVLTILLTAAPLFPLASYDHVFTELLIALLLLMFPASQCAVEMINMVISASFEPSPLPKLDFSRAIPADCATLVAVPSLLLNEEQVRDLFKRLEVRYLANRDPHLYFALLTDLPDSVSKPHDKDSHPLVELAAEITETLNRRYTASGNGGFLFLHRHRIFNRRQGVWMGWERKRGKLLDLNKLMTGEFDAFPIKAGDVAALKTIRYILTLDSDTQLPRGSAAKLIGAIAHPLNQAIIDPVSRIVVAGYGILQPRIGVTVHSASRSRLASIFSGQTGLDIYTRAISDTYQDLFGEGIFTGKGIYELETLHEVLNHRFPRNALLSHDLIEGAYARTGLVTDTELIDDYPSHYSAHSRRKHRWVRGDWQIVQWMFSRVPEESGRKVQNPISFVSRWKIFDNLRRSLVDPFLFLLLIVAWVGLPGGALYWTILALVLLVIPSVLQLSLNLIRIAVVRTGNGDPGEALAGFWHTLLISCFNLVLLPHQALLGLDAVARSLVRRFVTGERLLEWETAAQAEEASSRTTPVDRYMAWIPVVAMILAVAIWFTDASHVSLFVAAPILLLWLLAHLLVKWLNKSPSTHKKPILAANKEFLEGHALHIWRYFDHYGRENHNYLIPDNVEEDEFIEAARVSPTNIGLLLNARQAACEFGFLTVPEFAWLTRSTLGTIQRLEKYRGHLFNWYDTRTLKPLDAAPFVSTVDSGNFVASLYTLQAGATEILRKPLLGQQVFGGLRTYFLATEGITEKHAALDPRAMPASTASDETWIGWLCRTEAGLVADPGDARGEHEAEARQRIAAIISVVREYLPWSMPEYEPLCGQLAPGLKSVCSLTVGEALHGTRVIAENLQKTGDRLENDTPLGQLATRFATDVARAEKNLEKLGRELEAIAVDATRLAEATEFSFLVHPGRRILSIGYDMGKQKIHESCYDMLASEARIATFLAIARGDMPQQSWFRLARDHGYAFRRFVLLSWTGTMFEYLMPALWMRTYPNTLIARTQVACVHVQRAFGKSQKIFWGISESGSGKKKDSAHYNYYAYGVPLVALAFEATAGPVVSPYSTFLALGIDAEESLKNLRRMEAEGWVGRYGFYEAADYMQSRRNPELVREWMAHHLGMSLLSLVNLLHGDVVQEWFHANALVQSAEVLLHEMPVRKAVLKANLKLFGAPIPREKPREDAA